MKRYTAEEVTHAREMLCKFVPQGSTVHCVLRHVSRSGMSRRIDFYAIDVETFITKKAGVYKPVARLQYLTGWMSVLFGDARSDKGMRVDGCGMDMGFHVVDQLASALYGRDKRGLGNGLRCEWI